MKKITIIDLVLQINQFMILIKLKKKKCNNFFKSYSNSKYQSVLTNNNLKHKPICDSLKKTKIHFENFKLFRRMPKYAQPSIKRIFRKKEKIFILEKILFLLKDGGLQF
jgi:hypothetical protein